MSCQIKPRESWVARWQRSGPTLVLPLRRQAYHVNEPLDAIEMEHANTIFSHVPAATRPPAHHGRNAGAGHVRAHRRGGTAGGGIRGRLMKKLLYYLFLFRFPLLGLDRPRIVFY